MRRIAAALLIGALLPALRLEAAEPPPGLNWQGTFVQGGLVLGTAPAGTRIRLGDRDVPVLDDGRFVFGFGRDEGATLPLTVAMPDGRSAMVSIRIAPRQYDVQRIDGLPQAQVTPPPAVLERIRRENAMIAAVRQRSTPRGDFLSGWSWPADGPVSGVYGSQRILNGEPRQPHFGLDIAAPAGTPVRASTDGIVVLAEQDLYFTGGTIIIDHGLGLTGAYSHLSALHVKVGERVRQGQVIGAIGATGRATAPHLDWRVNWFDVRIDPQMLLPKR